MSGARHGRRRPGPRLGREGERAWTAAEETALRRAWGVKSAAVIGRTLGRTRNSIIGKAHRLGLARLKTTAFMP